MRLSIVNTVCGPRSLVATFAAMALITGFGTGRAEAGPILAGTWYEFGFSAVGVDATGCQPADPAGELCLASSGTPTTFADTPPWTYTSPAGGSNMYVTDAFSYGDSFSIYNFGALLFSTPAVPATAGSCGNDPVPCYFDPASSSAVFFLGPGAYSLTIRANVDRRGAGYFGVSTGETPLPGTSVPEPATLLLLGSGLAAAGVRRMRKRA